MTAGGRTPAPLPEGFRFRPARDEDAEAVAQVSNEETNAVLGTPLISAGWLLRRWTAPGVDREQDVGVVEAPDGTVCAFLGVEADPPYTAVFALGGVHPAWHGRGIGAAIVDELERRARRFVALAPPGVRVVVHAGTLAGEPRVGALLAGRGYREVRRFWLMRIVFADGAPPPPEPPPGIAIRPLRAGEERLVYEAHTEAFADHWGEGDETFEAFHHHTMSGPEFDPALWALAWDGPDLAGYLGARDESEEIPEHGYVSVLGVRRGHRRRGIGEALLRTAFHILAGRGRRGCDLHVDAESTTGATRLYERAGMEPHPRFATWERAIRPGADPPGRQRT